MRDKTKTYIRYAKNVLKGIIKEYTVRSLLSLAEYNIWKRDYLEPLRGINQMPIILAKIDALSKSRTVLERDVSSLSEEIGKWNGWMQMVSRWKDQLEEFEDNPLDPIAIKLSNEIKQADQMIITRASEMDVKQDKLNSLTSEIDTMTKILTVAEGYKFLAIMGIL